MDEEPLAEYSVRQLRPPITKDLTTDVEWVCCSLGFLRSRDEEKTATRILTSLLGASRDGGSLSSDEMARQIGVTRGAVVHHLNKLRSAGLVIRRENRYELRMRSLQMTLEEIEKDIARVLGDVKRIAREIDEAMSIPSR